jgi:catechol 2,3-dioxygenase-like lactoylglutathione lyase family enzyme
MAEQTYFHVGIFVYDIKEAIERYSKALGLTFVEPIMCGIPRLVDQGREYSLELPLAYATQGPPYYELLEMTGEDGLYGKQNGEGINHLGLWDTDIEGTVVRLEQRGVRLEAAQYTPDGKFVAAYFRPGDLHAVRIELVDEARRPMMEEWIHGAAFEDFPDPT